MLRPYQRPGWHNPPPTDSELDVLVRALDLKFAPGWYRLLLRLWWKLTGQLAEAEKARKAWR